MPVSGKGRQDLLLEAITDLEARVRKIENELSACKSALRILVGITNLVLATAGIIFGAFKIFGRGKRGRVRGKSRNKK